MRLWVYFFACSLSLWASGVEVVERSYYLDTSRTWTVDDAYQNKDLFTAFTRETESMGFSRAKVWVYVKVKNIEPETSQHMLSFPYPLHDILKVYKYKDAKLVEHYTTGDLTAFSTRKVQSHNFVIPYTLQAHESKELLFMIDSRSSLNLGMEFHTLEVYHGASGDTKLYLGLYYGAVLIMLLYNFILYLIIKEKVYLYYVAFHITHLLLHLGMNAYGFKYFYPESPMLNLYYIPIMFSLANYFAVQFSMVFLDFKNQGMPRVLLFFTVLQYIFVSLAVMSFVLPYSLVMIMGTVFSMLSVSSLFVVGLYLYYTQRSVSAKFYVIAWSFLLLGSLISELQNLGIVPMNSFTLYSGQIGAFIELALLSFALAYRYNDIFLKLGEREQELGTLNTTLESKIAVRTEELNKKNTELTLEVSNKNILFRELYHRVKNNLQVITSLLSLQVDRVKTKESEYILEDTIQRIQAMALIHEKLYQANNLSVISMQDYTEELVEKLQEEFHRQNLYFRISCEKISLTLDIAVPMGLIINELVTNAIKYAFSGEHKNQIIGIKMYENSESQVILEVYDNGKGIEDDTLKDGFGFELVQFLATYQLKGQVKRYNDKGLHHKIIFKKGMK